MSNEILNPVEKGGFRHRLSGSLSGRVGAAAIMAVCMGVLVLAIYIKPNEHGLGSHAQLGMAECGFYERTGYPCPTCGMTTAFSHVVRGQWYRAFVVQPAGAIAALLFIAAALASSYVVLTGYDMREFLRNLKWKWICLAGLGLVLFSWLWLCALTWFKNR